MNTNKYYFSNCLENDDLKIIAVEARETMEQNENIVEVFGHNNELLYGHSPKQALLVFIKQNNKSIFSPSSSNESSPSHAKPNDSPATPIRSITDITNKPTRYLPLDDAEEKEYHLATLEFSTPTGRQKPMARPAFKGILNSTPKKTGTRDERFVSTVGISSSPETGIQESPSTEIAKMTKNLTMAEKEFLSPVKIGGRIDASNPESSPSTEIARITKNLTLAEKEFISPVEVGARFDASSKESSPSAKESMMNSNLSKVKKELWSPAREVGNKLGSQESPRTPKVARMTANLLGPLIEVGCKRGSQEYPRIPKLARMTANLTVDDDESRNLGGNQLSENFLAKKNSPNPKEISGASENPDPTNKIIISAKGKEISNSAIIESETPSPVKRAKICSILSFDTHGLSSPAKNRVAENSSKDTDVTANDTPVDVFRSSPNESIQKKVRDNRKRKSLSPRKKCTTPFKSMPRVVKLDGEEEISIEVIDLDYGTSPTTSRSKSADYQSESTKDGSIKTPVVGELNAKPSPKTPERFLHPSERAISSCSSLNASGTHSPGSDDDVFAGKYPSSPSAVATPARNRSSKFEYSSEDIAANPILLKKTIQKFRTLLDIRANVARKAFISFQTFQTGLNHLINYFRSILYIIFTLGASGKYSSEEFIEIICHANSIGSKYNKLKSWGKDIEFNLYAWSKYIKQIDQLKAQYEPLLTHEGEPAISFEAVQVYERKMREIWKKIDRMIMQGDSRRALFSQYVHDVERLMKMFVKCLIIVGVLQLSENSF